MDNLVNIEEKRSVAQSVYVDSNLIMNNFIEAPKNSKIVPYVEDIQEEIHNLEEIKEGVSDEEHPEFNIKSPK